MDAPWAKIAVNFYRHPRTRRLSKDAQHLYLASILYCVEFSTDGRFPADETPYLASVSRVRPSLADDLLDAGVWVQQGEDELLIRDFLQHQVSREEITAKSEKARKAAAARWDAERNAPSTASSTADRNAIREEESRGEQQDLGLSAFDEFWTVYPRKVAKPAARKAWNKAVKGADPRVVIDGAVRFAENTEAHKTDPKFIPHPASWLNAERWGDELVQPEPEQPRTQYR